MEFAFSLLPALMEPAAIDVFYLIVEENIKDVRPVMLVNKNLYEHPAFAKDKAYWQAPFSNKFQFVLPKMKDLISCVGPQIFGSKGNTSMVKYLYECGVYTPRQFGECFESACANNHPEVVKYMIGLKECTLELKNNGLWQACWFDRREIVKYLFSNGATINIDALIVDIHWYSDAQQRIDRLNQCCALMAATPDGCN